MGILEFTGTRYWRVEGAISRASADMTRYTVVWVPTAQTKLAELWLNSTDPSSIQAASDFVDVVLATHPHSLGMEISAGLRAATVGHLQVLYRVYTLGRLVKVFAIRSAI